MFPYRKYGKKTRYAPMTIGLSTAVIEHNLARKMHIQLFTCDLYNIFVGQFMRQVIFYLFYPLVQLYNRFFELFLLLFQSVYLYSVLNERYRAYYQQRGDGDP